jgi:hypothetical protein
MEATSEGQKAEVKRQRRHTMGKASSDWVGGPGPGPGERGAARRESAVIRFECPVCRARLRAADDLAGQQVACGACRAATTVPAGEPQSVERLEKMEVSARPPEALPVPRWERVALRCAEAVGAGRLLRTRRRLILALCGLGAAALVVVVVWLSLAWRIGKTYVVPDFDPGDFDRTARWAFREADRVNSNLSNGIATEGAMQRVGAKLRAARGQPVDWRVRVSSVRLAPGGKAEISFERCTYPITPEEYTRSLHEDAARGSWFPTAFYVQVEVSDREGGGHCVRAPATPELGAVRRGDLVRVRGTVNQAVFKRDGREFRLNVLLKDCKVSP